MRVWSSARYTFPLPEGHRFPIEKYALLRERVIADGLVRADDVHDPPRIARDDLLLVHTEDYVDRFTAGRLAPDEIRRLGFPWSDALVERSYRAAGGTLAAARAALDQGLAMNLAGGTHHAFPGHGEGFCVFNDVAAAIRVLRRDRRIDRALVVDLDVHQGNGTHAIFAGDDRTFTVSMHGRRNYPFHKVPGRLDVELDDGTGDDAYLRLLEAVLPAAVRDAAADLAIYVAGADPYEHDRLGRLALTMPGLARRDRYVVETLREIGLATAIVLGGGYARDIADTVAIHANTVRIAAELVRCR